MKLLPSRRVLCTPYNRAPCHFMQSHIPKVHACLAESCHLHMFGRITCATTVTRHWSLVQLAIFDWRERGICMYFMWLVTYCRTYVAFLFVLLCLTAEGAAFSRSNVEDACCSEVCFGLHLGSSEIDQPFGENCLLFFSLFCCCCVLNVFFIFTRIFTCVFNQQCSSLQHVDILACIVLIFWLNYC